MSQHTKSAAIGRIALSWCNKCQRHTRHRVDRVAVDSRAGKIGPCLEHHAPQFSQRQLRSQREREKLRAQPSLFGDRA